MALSITGIPDVVPVFVVILVVEQHIGLPGQLFIEIAPVAPIGVFGDVIHEGGIGIGTPDHHFGIEIIEPVIAHGEIDIHQSGFTLPARFDGGHIAQVVHLELVAVIIDGGSQIGSVGSCPAEIGSQGKFTRTVNTKACGIDPHCGEIATQRAKGISHSTRPGGSLNPGGGIPERIGEILAETC